MVGDSDDVSDIVQEIFIDFFNKTNNGSLIQHPKSWLYRATINKCIDNQRNRKADLVLSGGGRSGDLYLCHGSRGGETDRGLCPPIGCGTFVAEPDGHRPTIPTGRR